MFVAESIIYILQLAFSVPSLSGNQFYFESEFSKTIYNNELNYILKKKRKTKRVKLKGEKDKDEGGQTSWVMETLESTAHLLNSTKHYQTYKYTKREKQKKKHFINNLIYLYI